MAGLFTFLDNSLGLLGYTAHFVTWLLPIKLHWSFNLRSARWKMSIGHFLITRHYNSSDNFDSPVRFFSSIRGYLSILSHQNLEMMKIRSIRTTLYAFTLILSVILTLLTSYSNLIAQTTNRGENSISSAQANVQNTNDGSNEPATIQGTIRDSNGQPVIGANIYILDSYNGAASSPEGQFSFQTELEGSQILAASAVGYMEFQQSINLEQLPESFKIILQEETKRLDDLVINAGVFDASDEKKSTILKPLDIVTTAGATADIPGVMNTLPGTQTVGETGRLFVRGGDDAETKYYIDGIMVNQPYGLTPNNIPSRMRFSPFLFSGTTFSTGGYSAEFGQALSGTLNLKTDKEALQTQTDLSLMSVGGGISHTQKWDRNSVFIETFYTDLTPYFWLIPQKTEWNDAPSSWQNTFMFRQKVGEEGNLKVFYSGEISKMDLYQPSVMDVTEEMRVDMSNNYHYLNANYQAVLNKYWMIDAGISNTWSKDNMYLEYFSSQNRLNNLHFKFTTIFDKGKAINLKIGTDIFQYTYSQSTYFPSEGESDTTKNTSLSRQINEWIPSVYFESNIYFSNKFIGVIGARMEYATMAEKSTISPRISLAYKTGKFSQISLATGIYRQRPLPQMLSFNNSLNDERAVHYILNFQYSNDQRTFRAEAYYKDYDQLVQYNQVDITGYDKLSNSGYGYAAGLDVFWRDNKTIRNVDYWLSYSFLDTERLYRDFPNSSVPHFASRHNFSFVYKHFIQQIQTQIGLTYAYGSGRPYNDPNMDVFNAKVTPDYHDLSMNFSYLLKTNFIIHFSVTNVLGRDNIFGYQYSLVPDQNGAYAGIPIGQPAKRFIFLGVFITLTKDKTSNQLRNL